jgi:hypothetical protein
LVVLATTVLAVIVQFVELLSFSINCYQDAPAGVLHFFAFSKWRCYPHPLIALTFRQKFQFDSKIVVYWRLQSYPSLLRIGGFRFLEFGGTILINPGKMRELYSCYCMAWKVLHDKLDGIGKLSFDPSYAICWFLGS